MAGVVDLGRWPIADLRSPRARCLVEQAHASVLRTGVASFEGFLRADALAAAAAEARALAPTAWVTDDTHNAYQLPGSDDTLPVGHVRNAHMRTKVASSAWDELGGTSVLRRLYMWDGLPAFVAAVTGRPVPYRLADPLGACSINVFRPEWVHGWHFDEAEFTVTLSLQEAEVGGAFEYTPPLRSSGVDLAAEAVAATVAAHPPRGGRCPVRAPVGGVAASVGTAPFAPGTLQIFAGRYCLHRVTQTAGQRDRLVAVLCFASEPGLINSPEVQRMFWGRVAAAPSPSL
jgi:hypothetical protein